MVCSESLPESPERDDQREYHQWPEDGVMSNESQAKRRDYADNQRRAGAAERGENSAKHPSTVCHPAREPARCDAIRHAFGWCHPLTDRPSLLVRNSDSVRRSPLLPGSAGTESIRTNRRRSSLPRVGEGGCGTGCIHEKTGTRPLAWGAARHTSTPGTAARRIVRWWSSRMVRSGVEEERARWSEEAHAVGSLRHTVTLPPYRTTESRRRSPCPKQR